MSLLAILYHLVPESPILVACNREDSFERSYPTPAIHSGKPRILASVDPKTGGTFLGVNQNGMLVGVTAPLGAGLVRASYSAYENKASKAESKQMAVGYVHNLSKRTRAYVTYANVKNGNGATAALGGATGVANKASSGFDIGMTHSF
jgi:predicted porin